MSSQHIGSTSIHEPSGRQQATVIPEQTVPGPCGLPFEVIHSSGLASIQPPFGRQQASGGNVVAGQVTVKASRRTSKQNGELLFDLFISQPPQKSRHGGWDLSMNHQEVYVIRTIVAIADLR
jgi:hypothetical protein